MAKKKNTGVPYEKLVQGIFQAIHDQEEVATITVEQHLPGFVKLVLREIPSQKERNFIARAVRAWIGRLSGNFNHLAHSPFAVLASLLAVPHPDGGRDLSGKRLAMFVEGFRPAARAGLLFGQRMSRIGITRR